MNREAILRKAEQLLREGKLPAAIDEYVRLVQGHPRDWAVINTLGDLYVRAGRPELAVAQFTRVADYLFDEGFLPKAQAAYKKALKFEGGSAHTLRRLAEIAIRQGLLADARTYQRQLDELHPPAATPDGTGDSAPGVPHPDERVAASQPAPEATAAAPAATESTEKIPDEAGQGAGGPERVAANVFEVDLSDVLIELGLGGDPDPEPPPAPQAPVSTPPVQPPRSLESVFSELRTAATFEQPATSASAHYELAQHHLRESRWDAAIAALEASARAPDLRFKAGSQLGRLLLSRGLVQQGIDWLERAVEAPAPEGDGRAALMYELADALEQIEESARALAVLLELDAERPRFRDVAERIRRLKRMLAGT